MVQSEVIQESAGVLMTNKVGQKYQCSVTDASGSAPNDTADSADGGLEAKRRSMAAVAAGPCILATGLDWWQYEVVCHNIHGIKILPLILHSWWAQVLLDVKLLLLPMSPGLRWTAGEAMGSWRGVPPAGPAQPWPGHLAARLQSALRQRQQLRGRVQQAGGGQVGGGTELSILLAMV